MCKRNLAKYKERTTSIFIIDIKKEENMAESDWDTVTVLHKRTPKAAQLKSQQVGSKDMTNIVLRNITKITLI